MSENKVSNLLGSSIEKIKQMVDVNTVVGDPITTPDGPALCRVVCRRERGRHYCKPSGVFVHLPGECAGDSD